MGHDRGRREKISNIDVSIEFKLTLMIFFFGLNMVLANVLRWKNYVGAMTLPLAPAF